MSERGAAAALLLIDATQAPAVIAVGDGGSAPEERRGGAEAGARLADDLPRLLRETLASSPEMRRSISGVVVAVGPGAFTGVRVGVAMGRAVAFALGVRSIGVDGFASLAAHIRDDLGESGLWGLGFGSASRPVWRLAALTDGGVDLGPCEPIRSIRKRRRAGPGRVRRRRATSFAGRRRRASSPSRRGWARRASRGAVLRPRRGRPADDAAAGLAASLGAAGVTKRPSTPRPQFTRPRPARPRLAHPRLARPRLAHPRLARPRLAHPRPARPHHDAARQPAV